MMYCTFKTNDPDNDNAVLNDTLDSLTVRAMGTDSIILNMIIVTNFFPKDNLFPLKNCRADQSDPHTDHFSPGKWLFFHTK